MQLKFNVNFISKRKNELKHFQMNHIRIVFQFLVTVVDNLHVPLVIHSTNRFISV